MSEDKKEAEKEKYIVVSKFAHFKPNDTIEFEKGNVPAGAQAHVKLLDSSREKAEDESLEILQELHETITGKPVNSRAGAKTISAKILEFLSKGEEDTDE